MTVSRRELVKVLIGATAAAAGLGGLAVILRRLLDAPEVLLSATTSGDLSIDSTKLGALVTALFILKPPNQTDHYEQMFRVRSTHSTEHWQRYSDATAELDRRAEQAFDAAFGASLDAARRRSLIEPELELLIKGHEADSPLSETLLDILRIYLYTDAYIAVGYASWPGMVRGLEAYQQPEHQPSG